MKFNLASLVLLMGSTEAVQIQQKTEQQMLAEIEAMSMNANMHQIGVREKTLLKTYLQVDLNEYLQQQMDTQLFEGVDEGQKAQFIGNFFHFIKCRFQDCQLLQTKSKINMKSPTGVEMKAVEDKREITAWASGKGNHVPSHNEKDVAYVQTSAKNPTGVESKVVEDKREITAWASGKGNHVPSHNEKDVAYVQTADSVTTPPANSTAPAASSAVVIATEVQTELKKEEAKELVKPTTPAENQKDPEPAK